MSTIFPIQNTLKNPFQTSDLHSVFHRQETVYFRGLKTWALVPAEIKE